MDLTPIPLGSDVLVHPFGGNYQILPSVTALADGGFIVAWARNNEDGSSWGIFAQRYAADGTAVGGKFQVNTFTSGEQTNPTVEALADGGFVVVWQSAGQDGSAGGTYAQRYAADGTAAGSEFRVNTLVGGDQIFPSVTALADGGFVVTYQSTAVLGKIYAQRYAADGSAVGGEFPVSTGNLDVAHYPAVAALADGGFVVTWQSHGQDGSSWGIYGQRYAADGTAVGGEFLANTYTINEQSYPTVVGLADGGFVVTWSSRFQDGSSWGIYGQRYGADSTAVGGEFRVNTETVSEQSISAVMALADGGFVVTWNAPDGDGFGIYGQRFGADGTALGAEFRVNATTASNQSGNTYNGSDNLLAVLADGRLVQVWQLPDAQSGVYFRLIDIPASNTAPEITSDGGGDAAATSVAENAALVTALAANDPDSGQILTWTIIGGEEQALFEIVNGNELRLLAAPDFEALPDAGVTAGYQVEVQVADGAGGFDTQVLTVTVTDQNDVAATITSGAVAGLAENTAAATVIYDADATDPDTVGTLTWALSGDDAALFTIDADSGEVRFLASPDYDAPLDLDGNNVYDIVVHANAGVHDTTQAVAVSVTNVGGVTISGGNGGSFLVGTIEEDLLIGGNGKDVLAGNGGNDTLFGNNGNDALRGGAGNDILDGGNGNDVLAGEQGNDILTGGNGADTFYFFGSSIGYDVVTDFKPKTDQIRIDDVLFANVADVLAHAANDGLGNSVITYDADNTVTLQGVTVAQLHASDFLLV